MEASSRKITEEDIKKAIEEYLRVVPALFKRFISGFKPSDERCWFNIFGQQPYLLINKYELEKLPLRILRRLPIYLVKQFEVQVELDSLWYWALTHDVVLHSHDQSDFDQWPLKRVFTTLMAAHLAKLGSAPRNSAVERLNRIIDDAILQPTKDLVYNKDIILCYLCYPVLEGLVKLAMSPFIDTNGQVTRAFHDGKRQRKPAEQISSLAILLRALERNASSLLSKPDLGQDLKDFRLEVEKLLPAGQQSDDGWDSMYRLRIVSAHGVAHPELRAGLVTNLICLIAWHLLDDQVLNNELQRIVEMPRHFRTTWDFYYYPPEL